MARRPAPSPVHAPRQQRRRTSPPRTPPLARQSKHATAKWSCTSRPRTTALSDTPSLPRREPEGALAVLAVLSLIVGVATGLIAALFRLGLEQADTLRARLLDWAHSPAALDDWALGYGPLAQWAVGQPWIGFVVVIGVCAIATATAAWMVRQLAPQASGSGIPHVEAVIHGDAPPGPYALVPVKFIGGILAIGSGLALGREGPSVQMGAGIATFISRLGQRGFPDSRVLMAAGAGAGLATAFNAPLAGAIFVLEELVQRYEPRIAIAALGSSITAISVSRAILGDSPDFTVAQLTYPPLAVQVLFLGLGLVSGLLAVAYNITVLGTLGLADRLGRIPVEARGALIGAAVGVLAWFHPALVGGGDPLTQQMLLGGAAALPVAAAFAVRFVLGAVSYAAMTPGGLFAPMLTLGAQSGLMFGIACQTGLPGLEIQPEGFALVGMAAFFAGVVRSPVTGLILVGEMTHNVALLLPMVGACFTAMLVPALLRNMPIYESLRERAAQHMEAGRSR